MSILMRASALMQSTSIGPEFDGGTGLGSVSIDTANARLGLGACYKVAPVAQQAVARYFLYSSIQTRIGYSRMYMKFQTAPAATQNVSSFTQGANSLRSGIQMTSAGILQLINTAGTQVGSNSAALVAGHYYRIEQMHDAINNLLEARLLDCGTSGIDPGGAAPTFASGSNTGTITWSRWAFGCFGTADTALWYVGDMGVNDDVNDGGPTTWCGSEKVIRLNANAAGDSNGFTVAVGGTAGASNNYTRINETTPDGASTYNASAVLNAEDLYNFSNPSIGANDVVNAVLVGGQHADLVGADATAGFKYEVIKTSGGTKSQSAQIDPNSTTFVTNNNATTSASQFPINAYKDPDGTAWNATTINSLQAGMIVTATNVDSLAISTVIVLVCYTPAVLGSRGSGLLLAGVG